MTQAADEGQAPTWSVVCTAAEPRLLIEAFVAHHLQLGAERVIVFLDDPGDVVAPTLSAHPQVTAILCDAAYWSGRKGGRPADHRLRQTHNAHIAARDLCTSDWLCHIDADEFLYPRGTQGIAALLADVPPDMDAVRIRPAERMFRALPDDDVLGFDGIFKVAPPSWNRLGAELYGPSLGALFPNGFQGHVAGKSFKRTRRRDTRFAIHFVCKDGERIPHHLIAPELAVLLHLFPASHADWRRKYERRIYDAAYLATMTAPAQAQYGAYRQAQEQGGDAALRDLFAKLSVIPAETAKRMLAKGAALAPSLDIAARAAALFRPLRPADFVTQSPSGSRPPDQRVFLIGLDRCGSREICQSFAARGFSYSCVHGASGALAQDLGEGQRPWQAWDGINLLAGLAAGPEGAPDLDRIAAHYPDAVYLLNTRRVEDWIASRAAWNNGQLLRQMRQSGGLDSDEAVKAIWRKDWAAHLARVAALEGRRLRVLRWNLPTEKPHLFFQRLDAALATVPA